MQRVYKVLDLLLALCNLILSRYLLLMQGLVSHAYTGTYSLEQGLIRHQHNEHSYSRKFVRFLPGGLF